MDSDELKSLDESRVVEVKRSALRRIHLATLTTAVGQPTDPPVDDGDFEQSRADEAPRDIEIVIRRVDEIDRAG
jgi:hypothetical protein